jgi:hypothetical protein
MDASRSFARLYCRRVPRLTIAFVGQCHTVGYPGVPPDVAFPQVCREVVQASRRDQHVEIRLQPYYHPVELESAVTAVLRARPRVVVIEVVGWLAVTGTRAVDLSRLPPGVRQAYQRVRHFRHVSRVIAAKVPVGTGPVFRAATTVDSLAGGVLKPLLPRYPRPTLAEYEECVSGALQLVASHEGSDAVVQGPGAPNLAMDSRGIAPDVLERYRAVNEMASRAAAAHGALFVNRWDTVTNGFYGPGSIRPTAGGHSVWGQLLAAELLRAGVV